MAKLLKVTLDCDMSHSPWHPVIPSNQFISIPGPPQREAENTIPSKEYLKEFHWHVYSKFLCQLMLIFQWFILVPTSYNYSSLPHVCNVVWIWANIKACSSTFLREPVIYAAHRCASSFLSVGNSKWLVCIDGTAI